MNETRTGCFRNAAAGWAVAGSIVCALALFYHALTIAAHQDELHKVTNYAPDAVIVCGNDGRVLYANEAVKTITGFTEEDLVRGGVEQVIPGPLRMAHRSALERAEVKTDRGIEGVSYRRVYPVLRKDGKMILCLISVGSVRHFNSSQYFAFIAPVSDAIDPAKAESSDTAQVEP